MMLKAVIEYIRMPESLIGKGEFFALVATGESMEDVGIHFGDYVVIRKQNTADIYPEELQVQGVAVSVTHKLGKIL